MDQFLGFSGDNSSLVMNVRNLRTGYVSPQFHVVFDDLFHTNFSSGDNDIVIDAICNQLFKSNHDVYAEDEFIVNGEFIYFLPFLDVVWLSEPELQDREEKMHAQCHQYEECQCIQICSTPLPMIAPSPNIAAVLDDYSSVDSSPHVEMS